MTDDPPNASPLASWSGRRPGALVFGPLVSVLLAAHGTSAAAAPPLDPSVEARGLELYQNGESLYQDGSYAAAIQAWQEGYRLTHRSDFLWNIAAAQERLGDLAGALATLDEYRAFASADERESLERRIRSLETRLGPVPTPTPAPAPVPWVPTPVPSAPIPVPPAPAPSLQHPARDRIGWSLLASGVLGLGLGGVFGSLALQDRNDANDLCVTSSGGLWCPTTAEHALDADRQRSLVADLGFGAGGVIGISGMVVLLHR